MFSPMCIKLLKKEQTKSNSRRNKTTPPNKKIPTVQKRGFYITKQLSRANQTSWASSKLRPRRRLNMDLAEGAIFNFDLDDKTSDFGLTATTTMRNAEEIMKLQITTTSTQTEPFDQIPRQLPFEGTFDFQENSREELLRFRSEPGATEYLKGLEVTVIKQMEQ